MLNKIERLIAGIIQAEMNYEKEMEEWESNEKGELEYGTSGNYEDEDDFFDDYLKIHQ
jgi:hypothetical protein